MIHGRAGWRVHFSCGAFGLNKINRESGMDVLLVVVHRKKIERIEKGVAKNHGV